VSVAQEASKDDGYERRQPPLSLLPQLRWTVCTR